MVTNAEYFFNYLQDVIERRNVFKTIKLMYYKSVTLYQGYHYTCSPQGWLVSRFYGIASRFYGKRASGRKTDGFLSIKGSSPNIIPAEVTTAT